MATKRGPQKYFDFWGKGKAAERQANGLRIVTRLAQRALTQGKGYIRGKPILNISTFLRRNFFAREYAPNSQAVRLEFAFGAYSNKHSLIRENCKKNIETNSLGATYKAWSSFARLALYGDSFNEGGTLGGNKIKRRSSKSSTPFLNFVAP